MRQQERHWSARTTAEREARLAMAGENPPRLAAVTFTGRILAMQGRYAEGLDLAQSATDRVARGAAVRILSRRSTRGDLLAHMGRLAEAEAAFREEITRFPSMTCCSRRRNDSRRSRRCFLPRGRALRD
jgi:hypothetical protein